MVSGDWHILLNLLVTDTCFSLIKCGIFGEKSYFVVQRGSVSGYTKYFSRQSPSKYWSLLKTCTILASFILNVFVCGHN